MVNKCQIYVYITVGEYVEKKLETKQFFHSYQKLKLVIIL